MLSRQLGGNRSFATSTTPKMKLSAPNVDAAHTDHPKSWAVKGEFAPVYMVMGMLLVAMSIGAHTAKQQLVHSPSVRVSKKRRKSIPEVEDPDRVVASADKFVNKSFLRKVAHIQEHHPTLPHPAAPHPFTRWWEMQMMRAVNAANIAFVIVKFSLILSRGASVLGYKCR
ncbi:hypothetical protein L1049_006290 [Liquidambar formosana]|uniref:Uncharacterized protein n=1 Tax=Liquidambar formosana TaxID=63359 RepID=A0AAP0RF68_LIQFO